MSGRTTPHRARDAGRTDAVEADHPADHTADHPADHPADPTANPTVATPEMWVVQLSSIYRYDTSVR
jgi:hypothetical protein